MCPCRPDSRSRPTRVARSVGEGELPAGLEDEVAAHVERLEQATGKRFGDPSDPLLLSVRSGAPISMPGMMDTILNLGLNDDVGERHRRTNRESAVRERLLSPIDPDVRRGRRRDRGGALRRRAHRVEAAPRSRDRRRSDDRRSCRADRQLSPDLRSERRQAVSAGSARAARSSDPGRFRVVECAASEGLPACLRDSRRPRYRCQRRPDGLREQGRRLGDGCLLHPQPVDGRGRALRRVPSRRAGRRCRLRDPHAAADRQAARC